MSFRRKPENIHVGRYVETWHKLWPVARRAVLGWRPRQARGERPRRFERPSVRPPREKRRGEKKKKSEEEKKITRRPIGCASCTVEQRRNDVSSVERVQATKADS